MCVSCLFGCLEYSCEKVERSLKCIWLRNVNRIAKHTHSVHMHTHIKWKKWLPNACNRLIRMKRASRISTKNLSLPFHLLPMYDWWWRWCCCCPLSAAFSQHFGSLSFFIFLLLFYSCRVLFRVLVRPLSLLFPFRFVNRIKFWPVI